MNIMRYKYVICDMVRIMHRMLLRLHNNYTHDINYTEQTTLICLMNSTITNNNNTLYSNAYANLT